MTTKCRLVPKRFTEPDASARTAVVVVSSRALGADQVEATHDQVGLVAGVLADLGFEVSAITLVPDGVPTPTILAWLTGGETTADEAPSSTTASIPAPDASAAAGSRPALGALTPSGSCPI